MARIVPLRASPLASGLRLRPWWFRLVWTCVALFHGVCMAYYTATTWLYAILPSTQLMFGLRLYNLVLPPSSLVAIASMHGVIACIHAYYFVQMLTSSLVYRRLVFQNANVQRTPNHDAPNGSWHQSFWRAAQALSVDGLYFEYVFLLREALEIVLQSIQAYRMSYYIASPWLNRLYTVLLILNAWIGPCVQLWSQEHRLLQRLSSLGLDMVLDFAASVGIPVLLVSRYVRDFDRTTMDFPMASCWYNSIWLMNALNEFQLIFVQHWLDMVSRLYFAIGVLLSIQAVKHHVFCIDPTQPRPRRAQVDFCQLQRQQLEVIKTRNSARSQWPIHALHMLFAGWGIVVLGLHIHASASATISNCLLQVHPWLVSKPTCSLVLMDCRHPAASTNAILTGSVKDIDAILAPIDPASIGCVWIRHCPSVSMPPTITRLSQLIGLRIYNSTITNWTSDSALRNTFAPKLRFFFAGNVQFPDGKLPNGLLSSDFPAHLTDIEFSFTNLRELPEHLDTIWPRGMMLLLENSALEHFPPVLTRMETAYLSLLHNPLDGHTSATTFNLPTVEWMCLSGNHITALSDAANMKALRRLFLDQTEISSVPSWLLEQMETTGAVVFARNTPLCDPSSPNTSAMHANVICAQQENDQFPHYPLEVEVHADIVV